MWISQGILGQILENIRTEFASIRHSIPTYPAVNDSLMSYSRLPQPFVPGMYNSNPLHTMTLQLAAFRPTQIPLNLSETLPVQHQIGQPATIHQNLLSPLGEHSSITSTTPVNTAVQLPDNNDGAQNLGVDNQMVLAGTTIQSIAGHPSEESENTNPARPEVEEMDTGLSRNITTTENNT